MPRTSKKLRHPSYFSSVSSETAAIVGLSRMIGSAPAVGGEDEGGGAGDADLRGGEAHALGEGVDAADAIDDGEQFVDHRLGGGAFGRETEGFGGLVEDVDALLDDTEGLHLLAGPHLDHLISLVCCGSLAAAWKRQLRRRRVCNGGSVVPRAKCQCPPSS
ncbi:hypothetical protein ACWC9T_20980 [Kitasatospora sp. NPDC001159]